MNKKLLPITDQLINRMCNVIRTCTGKALIPSVLAVFVT